MEVMSFELRLVLRKAVVMGVAPEYLQVTLHIDVRIAILTCVHNVLRSRLADSLLFWRGHFFKRG